MNKLFFELIRVTIGTQDNLSRLPSAQEWSILYKMAEKQSLLGVCFTGLQRLGADSDDGFSRIGINKMQYFEWMGQAVRIQQRNELVDLQCAELQAKFSAEGMHSCILKGQGVGLLYAGHLHNLRQPGDIDVLVWKDGLSFHRNKQEVIAYAQSIDALACGAEHHVSVHLFEDTEIEMHYTPAYFSNPFANTRFRKWCEAHRKPVASKIGFMMPDIEFNIVFLLAHMFRYFMSAGVGLRQLMDYYFVLKSMSESPLNAEEMKKTLSSFNMLNFAEAVMWVMKEVFGLPRRYMICEPNENLGLKLLEHVMIGGNFGHHNKKRWQVRGVT